MKAFDKVILTLVVVFGVYSDKAFSQGGAMGGGGGETVAADFVKYAQHSLIAMTSPDSREWFTDVEISQIKSVIGSVQVFAAPNKFFCTTYQDTMTGETIERCEDAHYYPEKNAIYVNQDTWGNHKCIKKMNLALHEYGRAAGIEDASYSFSSKVFLSKAFTKQCEVIRDAESECDPTNTNGVNCDFITDMNVKIIESECFKYLKNIPNVVVTEHDQLVEAANILEFNRCMNIQSETWRGGFGRSCSGSLLSSKCLTSCSAKPYWKYCINHCSVF